MAYPDGPTVRFRALADGVKVRATLPAPRPVARAAKSPKAKAAPRTKKKPAPARHAVAFSPDGKLLAAVGDDALVTLYDTDRWKVVRQFAWNIGRLRAVCFSADGFRAAALSATGQVMVWDLDV
jgi:hypothetical protein